MQISGMSKKLLTFKMFLEGGAATQEQGTQRVSQSDIQSLIPIVTEVLGISEQDVKNQFVGSTPLVLSGDKQDSGDIDFITTSDSQEDKDRIVQAFTDKFGEGKKIGESIFSFAAPINNKKVQFDLMFVESIEWGKFSYYTDPQSAHKSGVRNELLHAVLKNSLQPGKDLIVKDEEGNVIAKVTRSFYLNSGLRRVFKMAMPREDGTGYTKALAHAQPKEIQQLLDDNGVQKSFSHSADETIVPEKFVEELFGEGTTVESISSTEKLIPLIKEKFPNKWQKIFEDAKRGMTKRKFEIPEGM
jgi:hypothetical protein